MRPNHNRLDKAHIPLIGQLTGWEFLGLLALGGIAAYGIWGVLAVLPLFRGVTSPGSGGGAQMLVLMVFGPHLLVFAGLAIGGVIGSLVLLWVASKRRRARRAEIETPPENAT